MICADFLAGAALETDGSEQTSDPSSDSVDSSQRHRRQPFAESVRDE
jgi:hypothetical protein